MNNSISSQQIDPKNKHIIQDQSNVFQIEKRSTSKMFWNKRVIQLQNGMLSYFKVPKQMNDLYKMQPKISVIIENILSIGPPEKAKKQNSIEITFMAKDAIFPSKMKNRSTNMSVNSSYGRDLMAAQQPIVITKKKEIIIWEIAFPKPEIVKEFTQIIDKIKHPEKYQQQEQQVQQQQPQQLQQQQPQQSSQIQSEIEKQKSIIQDTNEKENQQKEVQQQIQSQIDKQESEQQLKQEEIQIQSQKEKEINQSEMESRIEREQQLEEENKQQQQKKVEEQKKQELQVQNKEESKKNIVKNRIKTAWNYNYLQAIELANVKDPKSIEECITNSFALHESIGRMRDHAMDICQIIIDELCLPNQMKTIKPTDCLNEDKYIMYSQQDNTIDFGDDFYCQDGLFIKLSFCQLKSQEIHTQKGKQEIQIYEESQLKALGNEFRYLSLLAEQIELLIQEESNYPLRVPLSCIIDYKGIRAFVMAIPPIDDSTLIHGPTFDGQFVTNNAIQQYMNQISIRLNLKQHKFFEDDMISNIIPMSLFQEVHKINKEYIELRWIENEQNINEFPPQNLSLYYLLKCGDLMPVILQENVQNTSRLRPEFVRSWNKPLNSDAYLKQIKLSETEVDYNELMQASNFLQNQQLNELIKKFESLEQLPIDSNQLSEQLHQSGINIKYIGKICQMCQLQHIKDLCICDMISRVCKKVLRNNVADLMKNLKYQLSQKLQSDQSNILEFSMIQELNTKDVQDIKIVLELSSKLINESCLDFLNLLLGVGKESDLFWIQIIQKQIWYDYQYNLDVITRFSIQYKCMLLYCLQQQLDISFTISPSLINGMFKESFPLKEKPQFNLQQKSYLLNTSKIARKSKRKNIMNQEQLFQSIKWSLELCLLRKEGDDEFANLLCEESCENANKALCFTKPGHPSQIKPLLQIIQVNMNNLDIALQYFEQILQILDSYFGPSHPYYFIIYSIFGHYLKECGYFNDTLNLYESALKCAIRLFQNHQCIADIYSDIGQMYFFKKDYNNASINYNKAISIYEKCNQYQSFKYANILLLQGQLLYNQQLYEQACQQIEAAIDILYQFEYSQIDLLIEAIKLLIQICNSQNKQNKINQLNLQLQLFQMRHSIMQ
ncbi:unnamed protein product [Paramecium pentaurelia]|uniref:Clu domain-containing protein n=1 Tax=Paramecium pentaurelia TaxID=43138 RepID=A0A8S1YDD9_9CILI|nr:unnamed protein product [Paramecium pentaurelia]